MSKTTCHGCPNLRINKMRLMTIAYCGVTDEGLIVPHEWNGCANTIKYTRVPEFCTNPDKTISSEPAPVADHVIVDLT